VAKTKERLDQLLVAQGLAPTRAKAQALILAGEVFRGEERLDKPGTTFDPATELRLRTTGPVYVSRGAFKLIAGLDRFAIDPLGLLCLDIGASTGGFTEVLLERGAARVVAVDVGHGQLDWRLRNDPRVVVLEKTNARHLTADLLPGPPSLVVCDASFIGLRTVLPAALGLAAPGAWLIALIKPQFEAGREAVGKGGVVRDPAVHAAVCERVRCWLAEEQGWTVLGIEPSPILGPKGNREFLIAARKPLSRPPPAA
jgi:23S rRNA (cytidine1920-2'-O)/16S rRNA (cytidine1409-2'-O)-methyltransferase